MNAAAGFAIGERRIGSGEPLFIICEAGVTNYGARDLALRQVDAAVQAGADAVKFQLWRTEHLVSRAVARTGPDERSLGLAARDARSRLSPR